VAGRGDGGTLDVVLNHARDADDALAKVFALAGPSDVRGCGWAATACVEAQLLARGGGQPWNSPYTSFTQPSKFQRPPSWYRKTA
jgi:hypothetical protein